MNIDTLVDEAMAGLQRNYQTSQARKNIVAWGPRCAMSPPGLRVIRACDEHQRRYLREKWRWIGLYDTKVVSRQELAEDIEWWWRENLEAVK